MIPRLRTRRIKCDETRPSCTKCLSTGRACEGYETAAPGATQASRVLLPRQIEARLRIVSSSAQTSLPCSLNAMEMRAFDLFRSHAVNNLAGHFSSDVFQYIVLQVSHTNTAVLRAVVAVGSMYQTRVMTTRSSLRTIRDCPMYEASLKQYNSAVSNLSTYIAALDGSKQAEQLVIVLITCLLFVCFEMLQGDQALVLSHLVTGLKILHERSKVHEMPGAGKRIVTIDNSSSDMIDQLSQVFVRLDADSTAFGRRAPYLCPRSFGRFQGPEMDLPAKFASLEEARAHLDTLTSIAFGFRGELLKVAENEMNAPGLEARDWAYHYCVLHASVRRLDFSHNSEFGTKQVKILTAFDAWSSAVDTLNQAHKRQALLMLRIQMFYPWFIIATLQDLAACLCDRFQEKFHEIINMVSQYVGLACCQSQEFTFGLEPGITASLYLLGIKCREPTTRRKAIEFLSNSTVQEGLWNRKVFALYCQQFMEVEERRARELVGTDQAFDHIPEQARFNDVVFGVDPVQANVGRLVCARFALEADGALEVVDERFSVDI